MSSPIFEVSSLFLTQPILHLCHESHYPFESSFIDMACEIPVICAAHACLSKFVFPARCRYLGCVAWLVFGIIRSKPSTISVDESCTFWFDQKYTVWIWDSLLILTIPCHCYIVKILAAVLSIQQHILWFPVAFPMPILAAELRQSKRFAVFSFKIESSKLWVLTGLNLFPFAPPCRWWQQRTWCTWLKWRWKPKQVKERSQ